MSTVHIGNINMTGDGSVSGNKGNLTINGKKVFVNGKLIAETEEKIEIQINGDEIHITTD